MSSNNINKHGLSRKIPSDIALQIRKNSKFGCVICRSAIYEYDHIDPTWTESIEHTPSKICLLCSNCHFKKSNRKISVARVKKMYDLVQHSNEVRRPFDDIELSNNPVIIKFGSNTFESPSTILRINGEDLLSIKPSLDGESFLLSGMFFDTSGQEFLTIKNNVWTGNHKLFDIKSKGASLFFYSAQRKIILQLKLKPPNCIEIVKLNMVKDNTHLLIRGKHFLIGHHANNKYAYIGIGNCNFKASTIAIDVETRNGLISAKNYNSQQVLLSMKGGEGVSLNGTGITIGKGSPVMHLQQILAWSPN